MAFDQMDLRLMGIEQAGAEIDKTRRVRIADAGTEVSHAVIADQGTVALEAGRHDGGVGIGIARKIIATARVRACTRVVENDPPQCVGVAGLEVGGLECAFDAIVGTDQPGCARNLVAAGHGVDLWPTSRR